MHLRPVALALVLSLSLLPRPSGAQTPRNSELPPGRLDANATVELHAHLFMNEGLTWLFRGDFFDDLKARDWTDRLSSQTNPAELAKSSNAVIVAALYANRATTWDMRESIRRQIAQAERFVSENPNWILARDPIQAGRAINLGKRVLVLALEGASGILETEEDLKEFIDQRGIAIVTPLHLMDDRFGGVAFLDGIKGLANLQAWLRYQWRQLTSPEENKLHQCEGVPINDQGLSTEGRELIEKLVARKVWIDLAHASDLATKELLPILKKAGQPLLYTHTVLRRYHRAERGLPDWMIPELKRETGIVGLMPTLMMLQGTPPETRDCKLSCQKETETDTPSCEKGLASLARQYRELVQELGASSVSFGSDWQGGVDHLPPTCGAGSSLDQPEGFWKMSQTQEVWDALKHIGNNLPEPRNLQVQRFLSAWERVRRFD